MSYQGYNLNIFGFAPTTIFTQEQLKIINDADIIH